MHTSREIFSDMFGVTVDGRPSTVPQLFPGFDERDRLGVVVREGFGAVGASNLILSTLTAFYDRQRAMADDFWMYPDYYLFHVDGPHGDHNMLDIYPAHKEVLVPPGRDALLESINDRGITRLAVPDGTASDAELSTIALASARARITTTVTYSATGRVEDDNVQISGNAVADAYVAGVLDGRGQVEKFRAAGKVKGLDALERRLGEVPDEVERGRQIAAQRADLMHHGRTLETYRSIDLDEALSLL